METVFSIVAFIIAIGAHEFFHAAAAYRLGDMTARDSGRLTLNPAAHVDLFGTLILPALLILTRFPVVFGWAKPVPVNPANFDSPRHGMMITSIAGPMANFILAVVFAGLLRLTAAGNLLPQSAGVFFLYCILINVVIGLFNLIPVPPLDGSNILAGLLPLKAAVSYMKVSRYGFLILIALLYLGVFERLILPLAASIIKFLIG
ncbi:MAG: site-2 protease family protein [Candidatus Omnitrophota bacterium]